MYTFIHVLGRRLLHRNEIKKVADKRQSSLADYCKDLLALPKKIISHPLMIEFFEATEEDINPSSDIK